MKKLALYVVLAGLFLPGGSGCASEEDVTAAELSALRARVDSLKAVVDSALASPAAGTATLTRDTAATDSLPATVPALEQQDEAPLRPVEVVYETYRNDRLGYSIAYPANVLHSEGDLDQGSGRKFASPDGRAVLIVFGTEASTPQALAQLYNAELEDENQRVTYKRLAEDWFVISGYVGDRIFYERAHQRDGVLKIFLLTYEEAEKEYFAPITERVSFSFEG